MSDVIMVLGKRGHGKSTWVSRYIKTLRRVLVYDTLVEPTYKELEHIHDFVEFVKRLAKNPPYFRIAYHDFGDISMEEDFDRFIRACLAIENITVVVEEVDLFASSHSMPIPLQRLVSIGRHKEISFIAISRRPHAVHPLIRSQTNRMISFKQTEPRDIDYLRELIGEKADQIPKLSKYKFVEWDDSD